MKRKGKGKHMLKHRNPVVQDGIKNPNRSNKFHGDKMKDILNRITKKEVQKELNFKD